MANEINIELLRKLLRYEPETGKLYWLARSRDMFATKRAFSTWNARYAGTEAITADNGVGYKVGSIQNRHFLAHRIAWAIVHGEWPNVIDHINGNPSDNRLTNLRSVDWTENSCNSRVSSRNTSGHTGVVWSNASGKWAAQITVRGSNKFIGVFSDKNDAVAARKAAERELGFHPNHGRVA
jgi:hypothetical protein